MFSRLITSSDEELFSMNFDGTGVQQLTNGLFNVTQPEWSPDGTSILSDGIVGGLPQLFVLAADGSGITQLTNFSNGAVNPDWSPNRQDIVFMKITDPSTFTGQIATMHLDGSALRLLTVPGAYFEPRFSPDGTKISFTTTDPTGAFEIFLINPNGKHVRQLTFNSTGDSGVVDWSPDGRKLVFESDRTGTSEIYTMNADGSGVTQLTFNPNFNGEAAWSPDGTKIAWNRCTAAAFRPLPSRSIGCDIWVMNADGSGAHDVLRMPTNDFNPGWQPL